MSNFDVAAGISNASVNQLCKDLFDNPAAKANIFQDTLNEPVDTIGTVSLTYQLFAAPELLLEAPSDDLWTKSQKPKDAQKPTTNAFQISFPDVKGSASINGGAPVAGEGLMTIIGELKTDNGTASLIADAIYIDEASFSKWDKKIVNALLIPSALTKANSMLSSLPIPAIPTFKDIEFQPVTIQVVNKQIVAGALLKTSQDPIDLSGLNITSDTGIDVLVNKTVVNTLFSTIASKDYSDEEKTGNDDWYAAGKVGTTLSTLALQSDNSPITVSAGTTNTTASGEIGGVGVGVVKTVLCPISTAMDAAADPNNWNKIIASFNVSYKPSPISITIDPQIAEGKDDKGNAAKVALISVEPVSSINVTASPSWSKSISGSILSAASSALIDLIPKQLQTLIVDKIINAKLQNLQLYVLPEYTKQVEGVNITVQGTTGSIPLSNGLLSTSIGVSFN